MITITDPCTHRGAEKTQWTLTRLSHTFHTLSFSETKAGKFRFAFTPRNTQNTHGPLVRPLKPGDMFFVWHTNSHSHTNVTTPSPLTRHIDMHIYTLTDLPLLSLRFLTNAKNAAGGSKHGHPCTRLQTF